MTNKFKELKNGAKFNYDAQEKVVEALWNFLRDNNRGKPDCTHIEPDSTIPTRANLSAVDDALTVIMEVFGYDVQPID